MTPDHPIAKRDIRALLANGELREALSAACSYAEWCGAEEPANQLNLLSGRLQQHIAIWNSGQIAYEEFAREQARIAHALSGWLEQLPEQPTKNAGKRKLLSESLFKKRLLWCLVLAKISVLYWIWRQRNMGTFNDERSAALFALMVPTFASYLSIMLGDYLRLHREQAAAAPRFVPAHLANLSYSLFPLYAFLLWYVLRLGTAEQELSYTAMFAVLSGLEAALGGLIGQIIHAFFKKD
ncbi:MAG: hypothetical protein WCR52_03650 [Bacteroidota bacterium]